jgi:HAMP domain-containing protein
MSKGSAFVVEVTSAPREPREVVAGRVADQLKLSPAKAASLMARVPGVITKPLPEERALRVVLRLQAAGLAAMHRRATPADVAAPEDEPAHAHEPAPAHEPPTAHEAAPAHEPPHAPFSAAAGERPSAPTLVDEDVVADAGIRNPTGYDRIPSLDATRVDDPIEPDPKLTPMREAGFGAADVIIPTSGSSRTPTIVDVGAVSGFSDVRFGGARPDRRTDEAHDRADDRAEAWSPSGADAPDEHTPDEHGPDEHGRATEDADPTMVMAPDASPPAYARVTPPPATNGARRTTPVPGPAPASRLRDAIARDRDGGERPRRPTLTDDDLRLTPPPDVAYRNTRSASDRPLTLTPPPDAVLKRSGVRDDDLPGSLERRRGRFGRRLSALVALPVTLSWLLSATFIYLLLPDGVRGDLWVPLAAATAIAALAGALAAGLATTRIASDVVRLRDDAQRIAMGELASPVRVRRDDELGDTASSVDRLRVSLQEALERLRKRR